MSYIALIAFCLVVQINSSALASPLITVTEDFGTTDVRESCDVYVDLAGQAGFRDIQGSSTLWESCEGQSLTRGLGEGAVWVRFTIKNRTDGVKSLFLDQPIPWIRDIRYFVPDHNHEYERRDYGVRLPFDSREFYLPNSITEISLDPGQSKEVYARFASEGTLSFGLLLHGEEQFEDLRRFISTFGGVMIGGICLLIVFNLCLFFLLRDANYGNYVIYGVSVLLLCGNVYGLNYQFLWPGNPDFNFDFNTSSPSIAGIFILNFMQHFFRFRETMPKAYVATLAFMGFLTWTVVFHFSGLYPHISASLITYFSTVSSIYALVLAIIARWNKLRGANYFLVAWTVVLIGFFVMSLIADGLVAFDYTLFYCMGAGVLIEMSLLSIALAQRIQDLIAERQEAQHKRLQVEIELSNHLKHMQSELKKQVEDRTRELEVARQDAEVLARTDMLTGLNNRRAFFDYGERLAQQSERSNQAYTIIMIDIDHFKSINDLYGHATGDEALKQVAYIVSRIARTSDIVARIGGEEFAIVLPDTSLEDSERLAERLRLAIGEIQLTVLDETVSLTASFGIATCHEEKMEFDKVLDRADKALYRAKNSGRNKTVLYGISEASV